MRAILFLLTLLLASAAVDADHCTAYDTAQAEVDTGPSAAGRFYVEHNPGQPCCWEFWIYEESNGIDGLQREDEQRDDTCHGLIEGDTIIF